MLEETTENANDSTVSGSRQECLVMRSISESNENRRKMLHNVTANTDDLLPYSNSALMDMIAGLDEALSA